MPPFCSILTRASVGSADGEGEGDGVGEGVGFVVGAVVGLAFGPEVGTVGVPGVPVAPGTALQAATTRRAISRVTRVMAFQTRDGLFGSRPLLAGESDQMLVKLEPDAVVAIDTRRGHVT